MVKGANKVKGASETEEAHATEGLIIMAHKSGKKSYPAKRGHPGKAPRLGSGARFKALVGKLAGKVKNPAALAAFIGRKKYGAKKFAKLSAAGRKRGK